MKYGFLLLGIALAVSACTKDNCSPIYPDEKGKLVSPALYATTASSPFTGVLEVYPCTAGTSTYFGNYYNDQLMAFNAFYYIRDGSIYQAHRPVLLPTRTYNLLYWGTTQTQASYPFQVAVGEAALTLGGDLAKQTLQLRKTSKIGDTVYMPVYDLVHSVRSVKIGTESIAVPLQRAVAGLTVVLRKKDGSRLDASIDSVEVLMGPVAGALNFYTAEPENFSKTIQFPLRMAPDSLQATNPMAMLFPSAPAPILTIVLTLKNGQERVSRVALENALTANTKLIVTVDMGEILSEETEGNGFEVSNWNEKHETIDSGIFG